MAAPTTFDRQTSFALFTSENPGEPHSGQALDVEFNAVKVSLDETQDALADIRESDGSLKRGIVTSASLAEDLAIGYLPRGVWSTGLVYVADTDVVFHTTKLYLALEDHTAGVFATNLAAGKWEEIADLGVQVLDDNTVDTQHLVDAAVEEAKIANSAVATAKIATQAVTTAKIADRNVTEAKLSALLVTKIAMAGEIKIWAGTTEPTGWLFCYGQSLLRATYPDLFTAIGTTYGSADGTHFTLPDIRGRVIAGQDDMGGSSANRLTNADDGLNGDTLGATGGVETQTLVLANLAAHDHGGVTGGASATHTHNTNQPAHKNRSYSTPGFAGDTWGGADTATASGNNSVDHTHTVASAGSGTAFGVVQPTFILNYIIKAH